MTAGQVAAVAQGAHAAFGLTGQGGADGHGAYAGFVEGVGHLFIHQGVGREQQFLGGGMHDGVQQHAADDAVAQRQLDFVAFAQGGHFDAVHGVAVFLRHDDVLHHVHQTAGEVTGVSGLQSGIGQTLAGAVRRSEVLQHGKAFTEACRNRRFDDGAGRLGHEAAHAAELSHLVRVASSTGVGHHEDRVEAGVVGFAARLRIDHVIDGDFLHHFLGNGGGSLRPHVNHLVVLFGTGDDTVAVLLFDVVHFGLRGGNDGLLAGRNGHVLEADGNARASGELVTDVLQLVAQDDGVLDAGGLVGDAHELADGLLGEHLVDFLEGQHVRQTFPYEHTAAGGVHEIAVFHAHADAGVQVELLGVVGGFHFPGAAEDHAFALAEGAVHGHVVQTENHVLRRNDDRAAVGGRENVVGAHEQHAAFDLRFHGKRNVHGHLVAVEVGVVGRTHERMQTDGLAFHEQGFKGLNAQTVQGRRAVQEHGIFAHHFGENVPHHEFLAFDHLLGALDGGSVASLFQFGIDEGLEEFQSHLLGQAALMELERRTDADNGTTGVVHALAEQVLTEAALLALDHVGQGLQRTAVGAGDGAAAATVVEQGIHRFLKHALFVADDDVRRAEFLEALQTVVAVDDAAVQIVEVGGREAAAVQRNQRTKIRRNDGNDFQNHPFRLVVGFEEGFHDLQALGELLLLGLALGFLRFLTQFHLEGRQIELFEKAADGFGAHAHLEGFVAETFQNLKVLVLGDDLHAAQVGGTRIENHVGVEIQHLFQIGHGHVEQSADLGRQGLQEPDVGDGRGQFDVAHALAAHLGGNDFNAALFADDAAVLHALVLAAVALVVFDGTKDLGAEKTVAFRLERTVVDGFRLLDFAVRPFPYVFRRRERDLNGIQIADVRHAGGGRRVTDSKQIVQTHLYLPGKRVGFIFA